MDIDQQDEQMKSSSTHLAYTADEIVVCGDLQQQNPTMAVILNDWV